MTAITRKPGRPSSVQADRLKEQIRYGALELFSAKGYEATSLREIASRAGVSTTLVYYYFRNKEGIVGSIVAAHAAEAEALLAWARAAAPSPVLAAEVASRWLETSAAEKLLRLRLEEGNPALMRRFGQQEGAGIGATLMEVAAAVVGPDADAGLQLRTRLALLSLDFARMAACGAGLPDSEVAAAAQRMAQCLTASTCRCLLTTV